jgi:hypothetical protein
MTFCSAALCVLSSVKVGLTRVSDLESIANGSPFSPWASVGSAPMSTSNLGASALGTWEEFDASSWVSLMMDSEARVVNADVAESPQGVERESYLLDMFRLEKMNKRMSKVVSEQK